MTVDLEDTIKAKAATDSGYAIAYALLVLAASQRATAASLQRLGNGDASTPFGGLEALGMQVEKIADAIRDHE